MLKTSTYRASESSQWNHRPAISPVQSGGVQPDESSHGRGWTSGAVNSELTGIQPELDLSNRQYEATYGYRPDDPALQQTSTPMRTAEVMTVKKAPYLKLLALQSYMGAASFFFLFVFRGLHHMELTAMISNPVRSALVKLMISITIGGNILACFAGILKRRGLKIFMKMMLSLDMLWEISAFVSSFLSVLLSRNMHSSKEEYISLMFWNFFMVVVAGAVRRANWH